MPLKYFLAILLLINIRSFPLAWHLRVLAPYYNLRMRHRLHRLSIVHKNKSGKKIASRAWWDSISPIGKNPFAMTMNYYNWASPDESDFNLHLSNSCYAKTLDSVRFRWACKYAPQLFREGVDGYIPLAATHFLYIREIPMLASYEVRLTVGSWGDKWMYAIGKFVTKPKKGRKTGKKVAPSPASSVFNGPIRTPADDITAPTPLEASTPLLSTADHPADLRKLAAKLATTHEEPDSAIVHCISISQFCFKIGRITIPPALVLAINGFSIGDYSVENPPPSYVAAKHLLEHADPKAMKKFLTGGWRHVPEEERWWEVALGGDIEKMRVERLTAMEEIRLGMDAPKAY
ncbi:uncharacterized protein BT62DRAFT_909821 [Guyanagaster necrorhizus]|uniref:Uncharacterized protein n=1 Tax=Guyanagaster necrorhizus TaxID=856835 RepID=A0A9P7VGS7_9AGAR|nr:uncharacterized protein BT62DRAFT_909821 [Guyanagaster necrorhizus MCA 3950]KAG7440731.1 hypothetical protein BT62DRAFT_909821 [Guyanagaster necrorhizus MCA 3950]